MVANIDNNSNHLSKICTDCSSRGSGVIRETGLCTGLSAIGVMKATPQNSLGRVGAMLISEGTSTYIGNMKLDSLLKEGDD